MKSIEHLLLEEYRDRYIAEIERLKGLKATQDEIQARATQIIIEYAEFEVQEVNEEIDLFKTNKKGYES